MLIAAMEPIYFHSGGGYRAAGYAIQGVLGRPSPIARAVKQHVHVC
jgi:hypothetical protein